jgi:hypothetical protein
MVNPFATNNDTQESRGPLNTPRVSIHGDELQFEGPENELGQDEPQRYKVPKTKWW